MGTKIKLLVGTLKSAFIYTSDEGRRSGQVYASADAGASKVRLTVRKRSGS